jgi:exosortase
MAGPIIVLIGCGMWTLGYNHAMQSVWHAGAVAVTVGAAMTVLGKNVLFRFLPAFAVLIFLVPIPGLLRQGISLPLQTASAQATAAILETFGIPIERSGNVVTINGVGVEVAEACNGMRMVFALFLVSYAFAFGMPLRNGVRALVLLASPVAAILCNVVRLIPTVLLYGFASNSVATSFHDISGWLMVPLAFMILLGVMRILRWALIPVSRYTLAYQ